MLKIKNIVEKITLSLIEPLGYELVDIEYQKEGENWILRLFIDNDQEIGLDDCQRVSNLVSDELDKLDPIPHSYLLEVSSPGIERPLKKQKDFEKYIGHKININLFKPKEGQKQFEGELLGIENGKVAINMANGKLIVPLDQVAKARLIADF